jgi:16S rRNA (guanine966-N2)-methyltransferase
MIRIIGGEFRSRVLRTPEGREVTRPMGARVKESLFNLLRGWWEGAIVIDLFAGVGTLGLEALSRGAKFVLMIEQNRAIHRILQENIAALGCFDRAAAVQGDALSTAALARLPGPATVMFVDPPYRLMEDERTRRAILEHVARCAAQGHMADRSWVVLRSSELPRGTDLSIEGFQGPEVHAYGHDMQVHLYLRGQAVSGQRAEAGSDG